MSDLQSLIRTIERYEGVIFANEETFIQRFVNPNPEGWEIADLSFSSKHLHVIYQYDNYTVADKIPIIDIIEWLE